MTGNATWVGVLGGTAAAYFLLVPLSVLVHELGHAVVALALTDGRTTIRIGAERGYSVTVGRVTVQFDPNAWRQMWYGRCRHERADSRYGRAAVSLAGPVASVFVLAATLLVLPATGGAATAALVFLAWWSAIQAVATGLPVTYPEWLGHYAGMESDGKLALRALQGRT